MAKGIKLYREYVKIDSLKDSYETQLFTEKFNNLLNVLNRKHPAEGIKINSLDFKVCNYLPILSLFFTIIYIIHIN